MSAREGPALLGLSSQFNGSMQVHTVGKSEFTLGAQLVVLLLAGPEPAGKSAGPLKKSHSGGSGFTGRYVEIAAIQNALGIRSTEVGD